ncbi:hypothetical protein GCM10027436_37180 [Actinophytocola sediminis]
MAGRPNRPAEQPTTPTEPVTSAAEAAVADEVATPAEVERADALSDSLPEIDLGTDAAPEPDATESAAESPAESAAEPGTAESETAEPDGDELADEPADETDKPDADDKAERPPVRHRAQRPAGKRRATGITRPADLVVAEASTKTVPSAHRAPRPRRATNPYAVAGVLAIVAVILAGLAFWFRGEVSALESQDPNSALTDTATTSEVLGQLTTAVETTLSYNYTDLESTRKAVESVLADTARCEYDQLFGQLVEQAPKQKLIFATTVRDIALVRLDGDRAEALVFIDLISTRVDTNKSVPGDAVFGVRTRRDGDTWKITEFDMFDQTLVTGEPVPKC